MNKSIFTSLILLSGSVFAANHAVLNVEGEIQINGKTVIDEHGQFLSTDEKIDLTPYRNDQGLRKTYTNGAGTTAVWDFTTPQVEIYSNYDENNNLLWKSKDTYITPTHFIQEGSSGSHSYTSDCSLEILQDSMGTEKPIGQSFSKSLIRRCEHSQLGSLVDVDYDVRTPLVKLNKYIYLDKDDNEIVLDDCIATRRERASLSYQEVLCRDVGTVSRRYSNGDELIIIDIYRATN